MSSSRLIFLATGSISHTAASQLQGTCYGCGAALQTEQEDAAGYVPPEKYELKRVHRQLGQLVCRCLHALVAVQCV